MKKGSQTLPACYGLPLSRAPLPREIEPKFKQKEGTKTMAAAAATLPVSATTPTVARHFTVLAHENQAEFDRILAAHRAEHRPVTEHQQFLVNQLAVNQWLLERARRFEARAFDQLAGAAVDSTDPDARIVARLLETNPKALAAIQNSAAQAERSYYRAWREIMKSKLDRIEADYQKRVVTAAARIVRGATTAPVAPRTNEPDPSKTKPSLRSQMPANLALCL